ncbi:helix-turn-helix domain-containing protein [Pseudonocardia saturnea]|jgi:excisionase family DNA binding protein
MTGRTLHGGPLLYTVEEAAKILTISRWKVFDLIRVRELRSVKIGGLRRVPRSAIDEYIARLLGEAS